MATATNPVLALIYNEPGTAGKIGKHLGISREAVWGWWRRGAVPAERVIEVEQITGISRHLIRPDIYPAPPAKGVTHGEGRRREQHV